MYIVFTYSRLQVSKPHKTKCVLCDTQNVTFVTKDKLHLVIVR